MAAVHVPEEFNLVLKPSELAALLAVVGTSPMITQSENNAKFVRGVDSTLSKYYTLAELGVVDPMVDTDTAAICVRLFNHFQAHVKEKMEATKAKLCQPPKS
jgi:hypothetical protein